MPNRLGPAFHGKKSDSCSSFEESSSKSRTPPQQSTPPNDCHEDIQRWINHATHALEHYGVNHIATAGAFLDLGQAYLRIQDYASAQDVCKTAVRVFKRTCRLDQSSGENDSENENSLRLAKALDVLGLAQTAGGKSITINEGNDTDPHATNGQDKTALLLGIQSFRKSFRIRLDKLGPTHVDTVETLNKIANAYMALGMYSGACADFKEVMQLRTAIMGEHHPSVAVAAQSVGLAYFKLNENDQAKAYYLQALNIFAVSGLANHKVAKKLRDDIAHLGFDLARVEI